MIQKETLIKAIQEKGYNIKCDTIVKNGDVELQAIHFLETNSQLSPTIYIDQILQMDSVDEACEAVINIYKCRPPFSVDLKHITDKDFILNTVRIGIQKVSNQAGIKRSTEYDGIEQYLYYGEDEYSIRLSNEILKSAGITNKNKLWDIASKNTFKHTTIKSMLELMREMIGDDFDEPFGGPDLDMWVITNDKSVKGASAILDKEFLSGFARKHGWDKIAILPSSIHECIIIPVTEEISIDYLDDMVREVNATQVEPTDRLIDHAIIVNF